MIERTVAWSVVNRLWVSLGVVLLIAAGIHGALNLTVDAVPDVTNVQVQVLTNAPGLSPLEVEALVTRPVELSLQGLPGAVAMRSVSRSAISAVTVVFSDETDLQNARTVVSQRLPAAREAIPPNAQRPQLGPLSTGLGEVYHFTVEWPGHTAREVRTLLDWDVAYALRGVPGVVEVNGWGGETRQVEVVLRVRDLQALALTPADVEQALLGGGQNAGAGSVERGEEQYLIRLDGAYRTLVDISQVVITTRAGGVPVRVADVATVREGSAVRTAAATADGKGETVYAMAQMVAGGNAFDVVARVKERISEIEPRLPKGARIVPLYDRTLLVNRVLHTVEKSLLEGGLVVILVLLLLLGHLGAGLVVATVIPLSMLGALAAMRASGMGGNLMSLGAIDFGVVVDGAVVMVEGTLASMALHKRSVKDALIHEGNTVGRPMALGVTIIALVYVPVLLLEGVEGKMFRPMGWTVLFLLGTAMILTFTWIPALATLLIRKGLAHDPLIIRLLRKAHLPSLKILVRYPLLSAAISVVLLGLGVAAGWDRGAEFIPRLEEGDLVIQLTRPPSVSVREAVVGTSVVEQTLHTFPEVRRVVSRTGSPDVATDVMGVEQSDVFVLLFPPEKWTTAHTREELVNKMDAALKKALPGSAFSFTQPIEMRVQELLGGLKSDVGVRVHGDDLKELTHLAQDVTQALSAIPGAADVRMEPTVGLPLITIRPNAMRMGRMGVKQEELRLALEAWRVGRDAGLMMEGERRVGVVIRLDAPVEADVETLKRTVLPLGPGHAVALGDVADVVVEEGPAQVSREALRRRILVEANVRGRDLAGFVQDVQRALAKINRPKGTYFSLTGQYENLTRAAKRLSIMVPITLLIIFFMLLVTFDNAKRAALILLNVPVAVSGGVVALWVRDLPFSISAAVGFMALCGVATLNGVVLFTAMASRLSAGESSVDAAMHGAQDRMRPVLTTAVVAALGFLPMALATGTGAEVQRPLASVVMGGLVTSTLLTLGVLPSLHAWAFRRRPRLTGATPFAT